MRRRECKGGPAQGEAREHGLERRLQERHKRGAPRGARAHLARAQRARQPHKRRTVVAQVEIDTAKFESSLSCFGFKALTPSFVNTG